MQDDEYYYTVCRYVERNALTANLIKRAEDWRWGSLYHWKQGTAEPQPLLSPWPQKRKPGWTRHGNETLTDRELKALTCHIQRCCPFGYEKWTAQTAQ